MEDKPSHVDETTVRSSGRIRPLSERARKIHRQKILVARANAAARQIEINALTEKAAHENELKELQRAMSRKKREIENERISVLLTVKRAKIQVYADTQHNGVLRSTSQRYSAMHRSLQKSGLTPLCQQDAVMDQCQMIETKSDIMSTIATSVNANRIPAAESRTSNSDPPTKAEDTHSLVRQEVASKLLKIGHDCTQEFAPLDCITREGNMPFAIRTRRMIGGKGNLNHTVDDAIYFNGGDTAAESRPVESCEFRDIRKELRCIVPEKESDIKYEAVQIIEKTQDVSLLFTEHCPYKSVQRIAILQQRVEGRRKLQEDSHSAEHTAKRDKRTDSVNHTQEPAPHRTTDIGKGDVKPRITRRYVFDPGGIDR